MKLTPERIYLGSARASRAGDGAVAIANSSCRARCGGEEDFGEGAEISTRRACAPKTFRFTASSTRLT
jgi:hypothetical protein